MVSSVRQVNERITNLVIPTKVSELENDSGYLTEHQSLENYITEENFATGLDAQNTATNALIRQVNERIDGITVPTKVSELENDAGYLTEHQSLADYSTTTEVQAMIDASAGEGGKDEVYVGTTAPTDTNIKLWVDTSASGSSTPSSVSWNDITDKPTIPSIEGLASTTYVDNKVAAIVIPTVPTKVSAFENDANYATEQLVNTAVEAQNTAMVSSVRQVNERITNLVIPTKVSELENDSGYLTEHQSLENYITEEHYANGLAAQNTATNALIRQVNERIDGITVPTKVSELENDAGYLTEHQSLADYSTTTEVQAMIDASAGEGGKDEVYVGTTAPTDTNIKLWVDTSASGSSTPSSVSWNDITDKPTIPSIEGLASTTYVDNKVAAIVIPTVPTNISAFTNDIGYLTSHQSLADYSTTTQVQTMISSAINAITNGNEVSY